MPDHKKRAELLLFNYETTDRTDFRDGEIKPLMPTVYEAKPACPRPPAKPLKDLHAMTDWRVADLPFDLYHKPKYVVRTHPKNIQQVFTKPIDSEREEVQKTRPRLIMTPALSMDDIKDPGGRHRLVEDYYTTSTQRALRSVPVPESIRAPFAEHAAPPQPIRIKKLAPPYVSPEWRMDSVSWDSRQVRAAADPTKIFWLTRDHRPQKCGTFHFV